MMADLLLAAGSAVPAARAQPQHVGQRQAGAERADLQEVAPGHAVAELLLGTQIVSMVSLVVCVGCLSFR